MLNKCILMGRLAADPEMKTTTSGTPCCTFRLAVERDGEKRSVVEFVTRDAYFASKLQNESAPANEPLREDEDLDGIRLPWEI